MNIAVLSYKQLTAFKSVFTSLSYQTNKAGTTDNTETLTGLGFNRTVVLHIKIDPLLLWADSIPSTPKAMDSNQFSIYDFLYLLIKKKKKKKSFMEDFRTQARLCTV